MTEEQKVKAQEALSKAKAKNIQKKYALLQRKWCIEEVNFFLLPYRLLMDLYNDYEHELQPPRRNPPKPFLPKTGGKP